MAHQSNIVIGGHTVPVWEFDSTAQQIDDAVAVLGAAGTPQGAIAALGAGVRPNLLDNAYFVGGGAGWGVFPVNQRGQTSYTPVFNGRVMDRWAVEADADLKVTLEPDGILLENTGSSDRQLKQIIPSGILSTGNQYCISALFDLISGSSTVAIGQTESPYGSLGSVSLGSSGFASEVVEPQTDAEWKYIVYVYPGAKVKIKALKLEEGSSQTLAYQKSDGTWAMLPQNLSYQQELAKCQAYLKPLAGFYAGGTPASSVTKVSFFVPGPMRALPVVSGVANSGDAYIAGAEIPDGIVYFGNGSFNVIQRGNGYIVQVEQPKSIGSLKNGRVAFDVGWLNAEL